MVRSRRAASSAATPDVHCLLGRWFTNPAVVWEPIERWHQGCREQSGAQG
ncbi:MAG: hypothetical protein H3C62_09665 [Gemmatimonadaceae bacterium]|nr:hypothetical protein [Gemmatimonadaceae bacterium]